QCVQGGVVGVEAKTGKCLWRYAKTAQGSPANIPTPVAHDGHVFSSTRRGGAGLVRLQAAAGGVTAEQVYYSRELPTSLGGAVLLGGHLYGASEQGLVCAEFMTGKVKWQDPCVGPAAVCYAD